MVVRRAWAEKALPTRSKRWEATELASSRRAEDQRRQRLLAWKQERSVQRGRDDAILAYIDAQLQRLDGKNKDRPPLMIVGLDQAQIRSIAKRPADASRMLRQAWRARIADAETQPVNALKDNLEGRGFAMSDVDRAPIDDLLPTPLESDARWLARRAATEVKNEPELRYVRYLGLVLPESASGGGPDAAAAAIGTLKSLLGGDEAADPLVAKLREIENRGRVGAVITKLEMADDFSSVTVETTLLTRAAPERWVPTIVHPVTVRSDDVQPGEGQGLAGDPQVQSVFRIVKGLGLGSVSPEIKQRSLNIGAATRQALGTAQAELSRDLESFALPVVGEPKGN
jgi:hypothetical protein